MSSFEGSISFQTKGQGTLTSEGTGVPVLDGNNVRSLQEVSGVEVKLIGTTTIGFRNRLAWFFVDQFGATGNGVTDDTAAIQAALTAAGASGKPGAVVYFPPGNYIVSATLNVPNQHLWLFGAGAFGGPTSELTLTADVVLLNVPGNACKVSDLYFNTTLAAPVVATAIQCNGFNLTVRDCVFNQFFNCIVQTRQTASWIDHCGFSEFTGIAILSSNSISPDQGDGCIIGCTFENNVRSGSAAINNNGSGGQRVISCKFLLNGLITYGVFFSLAAGATSELLVTDCSLEKAVNSCIQVFMNGGSFQRIVIVGNQIAGDGSSINGIFLVNGAGTLQNITVTGNVIDSCTNGITVQGVVTGVILSSNVFSTNTTDVNRVGGATAVKTAFVGDDNGVAPTSTAFVLPANKYGTGVAVLTTPDAWADVVVYTAAGPKTYKQPLYLP